MSTFNVHGFIEIPDFMTTVINTVSPVGQLSPISKTYSRDIQSYCNDADPQVFLQAFSITDETGARATLPIQISQAILDLAEWVYKQPSTATDFIDANDMITRINAQFGAAVNNLNVGDVQMYGVNHYPGWISYNVVDGSLLHPVKIWFADSLLKTGYKGNTIIVIPPCQPIDLLFGNFQAVNALLQPQSQSDFLAAIDAAKQDHPFTHVKSVEFDWVNPLDHTVHLPTNWTVLIYGEAGNNDDTIRNAIMEYVLSNSSHTQAEWQTLIPTMFASSEFIICPFWNKYAIPNQTIKSGMYSAIVNPADALTYIKQVAQGYDAAFINTNLRISEFVYRNLSFCAVGNAANYDGIFTLDGKFPDYLVVPSTSIDFARMHANTIGWVNLMNAMLPIADGLTQDSDIPAYMSVIQRGSVMFLASRYQNVLYLIPAKSTFP